MIHEMSLSNKAFERIKKGHKKVEVRLFDEKRQKIKIGDTIVFTNLQTNQKISTTAMGLLKFSSFDTLYSSFPPSYFGHPHYTQLSQQITSIREHYSTQDEQKYGVIGILIDLKEKEETV